ncbi:MAG TPA: hydroxymethylbilane synthase [Bordetella sp.]
MSKTYKIGTRASLMAVWQTEAIIEALQAQFPQHRFEMVTRPARADLDLKSRLGALGGKGGAFIGAMQEMMLRGEADMVMHSLKDLPGNEEYYADTRFSIGACLPRSNPCDALVLKQGLAADAVPAVIGTASVRRGAFLRRLYRHARIVPFRGSADKRIARLDSDTPMEFNYGGKTPPLDALVLAQSGLERIGLGNRSSRIFTPDEMCPAVGQGVVVAEYATGNEEVRQLLAAVNHRETAYCYQAERALLRALNGHCDSPIGAHAWIEDKQLKLRGIVVSLDGASAVEVFDATSNIDPVSLGLRAGQRLNKLGAQAIIDETRYAD